MVIQNGEEDGLAPGNERAVERIAHPQLVGPGGLETPEGRGGGGRAVQAQAHEVALEGPFVR
jgi:hypothetical protein